VSTRVSPTSANAKCVPTNPPVEIFITTVISTVLSRFIYSDHDHRPRRPVCVAFVFSAAKTRAKFFENKFLRKQRRFGAYFSITAL
jgi:hypothetical protein